ncbi:MBL fold metallo-hydrolase [Alicyclobacillus fastidiosus]|uniref:MBL fold metallo-hydrolase n=1 Tax=Alicyclobacillus fastidiosus TaxID=392011 RepID=A0ABV5AJT6_9BACL|nr:MBL fold metallo-hydrolase [Alicyclobacillus fastidiosus]WEH07985.1 MBL fold metallo-hydrolase [Alicyclobacillus fastidiosus]
MQELVRFSKHTLFLPPEHETDRPLLAAIAGSNRTLLVDAGNSPKHAELFLKQLQTLDIQGDLLVLTHHDWDHVFGLGTFKMPVIAHSSTRDEIKKMQLLSWTDAALEQRVKEKSQTSFSAENIKRELGVERDVTLTLPEITFATRMMVDLGGITCWIEHVGGDHASDSTVVYIPEEKVLFVGDAMYANTMDWSYTTEETLKLVQKLEQYDVERCFLSHHDTPLTKAEYQHALFVLKATATIVQELRSGKPAIAQELSLRFKRPLSEDELEVIDFFLNGLHGEKGHV